MFDELWNLTEERKERIKNNSEVIIQEEKETEEKDLCKKRLKVIINYNLWKKVSNFIEENSSRLSLFFNEALIAYQNGMDLLPPLEGNGDKKIIAPWVTLKALKIHQELPIKEKSAKLEIILHSYLEKMK